MSAKRPRPAIPVLVHVDNPTEAASVVVDTSTIEGKMDTVINNQERIYDKIPTSAGGGSADLTTVNEKTTQLAETIGPADSTFHDSNLFGRVRNLVSGIGDFDIGVSGSGTTVRALLYNIRDGIGDKFNTPTTTGNSVRDLLTAIKTVTGTLNSSSKDTDLIGCIRNLRVAVGASGNQLLPGGDSIRSFLYNLREAIGDFSVGVNAKGTTVRSFLYNIRDSIGHSLNSPTTEGTTVRDLLFAIKQNTASGGGGGGGGGADLTTVNEKTTALAAAIGSASDDSSTVSVIGLLKSITDKY